METIQLNLGVCENYTKEQLYSLVEVRRVTNDLKEKVDTFLINNEVDGSRMNFDESFACVLLQNGCDVIVGVIGIAPNDIRAELQAPPDEVKRLYHEYICLALDKKLQNRPFLMKCLRTTMQYFVYSEETEEEVFWLKYRGQLYSRVIDAQVLKANNEYTYYYINESEYFLTSLIQ